MIDVRTHVAALGDHKDNVSVAVLDDPTLVEFRDQLLNDIDNNRGSAVLGSLIDHLFHHAQSDGRELELLAEAAALWAEGVDVYTTLGRIRRDIESALVDPAAPESAAKFCKATLSIRQLQGKVEGKQLDIESLGKRLAEMDHIPEHPRQLDAPLSEWGWGDLFLARRTAAFVRTAFEDAKDPATRAMAFGIMSGYSANVYGSAYLTQVVGGPRRAHRFRDRVARNTMGAYIAQIRPEVKQYRNIATSIRFDNAPEPYLPDDLVSFVGKVIEDTYDLGATGPVPDLQVGYARLVRQLELLDTFRMPPAPILPPPRFVAAIYADAAKPPEAVITPETATPPNGHGPGVKPTTYSGPPVPPYQRPPSSTDSTRDSDNACGSFWLGVLAFLGWAVLLGGPCWEDWANDKPCKYWDKHVADNFRHAFENNLTQEERDALASQSQPLTSEQFSDAADIPQLASLIQQLFDSQVRLWEALGKASANLSGCGVISPDGRLNFPLYRQYLRVPKVFGPHRPEADPVTTFYRYPPTPLEHPINDAASFPTGSSPSDFLDLSSAEFVNLWTQISEGASDVSDLDLDADRNFNHKCWSTVGLIDDDPVGVKILGHSDM
ncbi:hypothetical protein [Streptomyces sp. Ag109_G2-15]|uniref:hypothetical protein n=1 Tax=Streptomyces sp. Ag109_G2-15 TaxID=1938850 RepID=UPI000BDC2319|nr:hypothetical protein [Streptomyces sp. Ag109_G2-15]SOD88018.1 hypothetical protein SAMN06272765_5503 [Streptomyces sp. Ag109_G2-15]